MGANQPKYDAKFSTNFPSLDAVVYLGLASLTSKTVNEKARASASSCFMHHFTCYRKSEPILT